jgi:hypothetical protein
VNGGTLAQSNQCSTILSMTKHEVVKKKKTEYGVRVQISWHVVALRNIEQGTYLEGLGHWWYHLCGGKNNSLLHAFMNTDQTLRMKDKCKQSTFSNENSPGTMAITSGTKTSNTW